VPFFHKTVINKSLSTQSKRLAMLKADKIYYQYQQVLNTVSILTSDQTISLIQSIF